MVASRLPVYFWLMLTLDSINAARDRLRGQIHETPLLSSRTISEAVGATCYLKCENLQKTGSFKPRGALNLMSQPSDADRGRGVVTISAGNHAQAVAWAAARAGIPATVVMPANASQTKAAAAREYGAEVILHGTVHEAFAKARELEAGGLTFVHPFDDERTVQGTASVGLEILERHPDTTVIVVPIGGGGLISGIATAAKLVKPSVRVFGVEPVGAAAMRRSLDTGEAAHLDSIDTIADGLAPPMAGEINFAIVRECVEDVVTVTDDEIVAAMRVIIERAKQWVEPSGAAGVAALLEGKLPVQSGDQVVTILSGGNIAVEQVAALLET